MGQEVDDATVAVLPALEGGRGGQAGGEHRLGPEVGRKKRGTVTGRLPLPGAGGGQGAFPAPRICLKCPGGCAS